MNFRFVVFSVLMMASMLLNCEAQKSSPKKKTEVATSTEVYSRQLYSGMQWRSIGPYQGGRSLTASGVIGNPMIYYEGATGGGVWKTVDGGITWFPVSDSNFHSASVGALAVAPSDPNIVYVGMGEAEMRGNISFGDGIYKSNDAGKHGST